MTCSTSPQAVAAAAARHGGGGERAWTAEQLRAIARRDGDLLLDAGAGSGKTSVLVERFVLSVLDDGIDAARILTITFTEKAAAELRDRIRARFHELGAAEEARATEGAFISTIHGFCARVLRAHALAAGLDPRFAVLDRAQAEPLAAAAFDDALQELSERGAAAVELLAAYGPGLLRAATRGAYAQLRSAGMIEPRLPATAGADLDAEVDAARAALASAAAALAAELEAVTAPGASVLEARDRVERCLELLQAPDLWPGELAAVRLARNGAALCTEGCMSYAEALARFRRSCADHAAVPVRDLLDELLAAFGAHYARRKRAAAGVDFEDLELLCRRLLSADAELRERYGSRFDRIMIDELQDTNRVQLELVELLARGNLFTVGDAQQSIYGFRHADVSLFESRGELLEARGARETLETNFRSRPEILDAVNAGFAVAAGERFRPLRAGRSAPAAPEPLVELVLVDKGADWMQDGVASPWRQGEARALADRLTELVAGGVAPAQIVVLIRATTDMRAYERALEERGLPTYVIGGRGYWSHPQVVDLVSYLRVLANPRDEEALYSVLASPLVGASLDALVLLAAAARRCGSDPWSLLRDPADELDGLAAQDVRRLESFAGWAMAQRALVGRVAPEELIDAALEQTGYDVEMLALPGGRRRLANVRKLMRLAREHEQAHGPGLRGFLELVADRQSGRGADPRESEAPVEGEGLDAIRLMTIHRAKGLEFDVVCVADLGRSPRPPAEIVRIGADGRLGLRLARAGAGGREPALDYQALGEERRASEELEERRLFYVAMTRARERLILSGACRFDGWAGEGRSTGGGPIAWIAPAFVPDLGEVLNRGPAEVELGGVPIAVRIGRPEECAPADGRRRGGEPGDSPDLVDRIPTLPRPAPAPPVTTLSYSSLQEYERCGFRFYAERVLGLPAPERRGSERGLLLHALLERLDFRRPVLPGADAVAAAAARIGVAAPGSAEAGELVATVGRFAGGELCARLGRAADVRREARFAFGLAGGALLVGALDVLAREPGGGALIVDYKSDRLGAEPVSAEGYAIQRLVYAVAGLRSGAAGVEVVHCFLLRPDEPATVAFSSQDRPALEERLRALAAGPLERRFSETAAPHSRVCSGCPAEGGLCRWPLSMTRRESPDTLF